MLRSRVRRGGELHEAAPGAGDLRERGRAGSEGATLEPCRRAQKKFLGQDFHTRLDVRLWVAQDESTYRCDVWLRRSTQAKAGYEALTGSLEGVLRKGAAVDLQACLGSPFDPTADQVYVPCDG
ncbi:MAG: hypothetical protein H0X54_08215 [Propionibacteriales bacterium]|nr:hypothetical protein [Propionibacteriales bacterium]